MFPAKQPREMTAPAEDQDSDTSRDSEHYTGVVVIHGLGAIARNTTLQEAGNTLAYWFNHKAGLALEREGLGRIWVRARLTDDPNPDAPAARASMQLSAPPQKAPDIGSALAGTESALPVHPPNTPSGRSETAGEDALRLEFREVWWAQSFGLPSITSTIAWARVQAVEQVTHLLIPIHLHKGSNHDADEGTAPARIPERFTPIERFLLRIALGAYSVGQYVWKLVEWLILTPLGLLLLLLMGLLRTLVALIPPLQSTAVAAFSSLLDTIMLHWVSEARVYTQDYIRSAGIRERFERELVRFLRDDKCERIVVIAHSMGTVIAYEGLTTILERPEFHRSQKPMTFICLAQALRRIWLMTADDPHRLRGVLPERVRWLHFWGRYDPVSAGPLTSDSLPLPDPSLEPEMHASHRRLAERLDKCENRLVVNTDSTFTDHTTYWENFEQVVGPIAWELVDGHPQLRTVVKKHLAAEDDILARRWQVAWRATLTVAAGIGLAVAFASWDASNNFTIGDVLAKNFFPFLGSFVSGVASIFSNPQIQSAIQQITKGASLPIVRFNFPQGAQSDMVWSRLAGAAVAGIGIVAVGRVIAMRTPMLFERRFPPTRATVWGLLALSFAYLALPLTAGIIFSLNPHATASTILFICGPLCGVASLALAIVLAHRNRQQAWEAVLWLLTVPYVLLAANLYLPIPLLGGFYAVSIYLNYISSLDLAAFAAQLVALTGCFLFLWVLARGRRLASSIFMLVLGLLILYYLLAYVFDLGYAAVSSPKGLQPVSNFFSFAGFGFVGTIVLVGIFMPVFISSLINGAGILGIHRKMLGRDRGLVSLPFITLVLGNIVSLLFAALVDLFPTTTLYPVRTALFVVVALLSLVAAAQAAQHVVRRRRWGWLVAMVLTLLVLLAVSATKVYSLGDLALAVTVSANTIALLYGLWPHLSPSESLVEGHLPTTTGIPPESLPVTREPRRVPAPPALRRTIQVPAAIIAAVLVLALVAIDISTAIRTVPSGLVFAEFPIHTKSKEGLAKVVLPLSAPTSKQSFVSIEGAAVAGLSSLSQPQELISDSAGNLWFIAAGTGEIGRIAFPGPSVDLFDLRDPGSKPQGITFGPGGDLWFTDMGTGKIGYLSPNALPSSTTGPVREFPLPKPSSQPFDIVAGPDGNLWFTEMATGKIGRMTPQGVVSEFTIPTPKSAPAGITRGPDGNLWFTEMGAGKIGRISTSGIIMEYPLFNPASQPVNFATDAKGNLWFTEAGDGKIGRITPQGVIGEIQLPSVGSQPEGITIDSAGNLWFTEIGTHKIGLLTPFGQFTDFSLATVESATSATTPFGIVALPSGNVWFTDKSTGAIGEIKASFNANRLSEPHAIVAGPDGYLWFTEAGAARIGLATPAGIIVELPPLPPGSQPEGITVGPDGNLWFTEAGTGQIGRISANSPASAPKQYPLKNPTVDEPLDIVTGPDGNLWFTDVGTGAIGRMTLTGKVSEVALPYSGSQPEEITVGPDGNLWFTEAATGRIGRITPQGQVHEFSLNPASKPFGIVAGPDGNLWFTEAGTGRIGRITPTGSLQEFPLPNTSTEPEGITAGPDGNLWFVEAGTGRIGRITPTGTITEYPLANSSSQPLDVATGSDGNLWFTEAGTDTIGRMVTWQADLGIGS